ncbi:hypothetical protein GHA01_28850 [Novacetimonas hansenii]|uniref:Uncharacterized protein n=1 Tax=Novacetimonas hansenii TaxID=436 RepID=A0ABQ0SII7_NOVHA|nr:hypothetical protein Gaha_0138_023 [Novacetimonas hansenii JCM 7643]GEC65036.1 hypothetical protein GHA01_28850 [Novacetimonas hansenii]
MNPLQHRIVPIAFPVGPGGAEKPKFVSDLPCAAEMWPSTEIDEIALSVKAQDGIKR